MVRGKERGGKIKNKDLKRRILEISYKHKLSHLGSCLTAVDIIDEIYQLKKPDEKFVLSSGHAGLALYCVIEKYLSFEDREYFHLDTGYHVLTAEKIFEHHGVHPDRCELCHLDCSTGSLGMGLPIAVGMALADRSKNVYCLISDGECSEGSIYEALRIAGEQELTNLKVYLNCNGWGAYRRINKIDLRFTSIVVNIRETNTNDFPFLKDLQGHYKVMSEDEFKQGMEILK